MGGHHAKLACGDELDEIANFGVDAGVLLVDLLVRVGGLVAS